MLLKHYSSLCRLGFSHRQLEIESSTLEARKTEAIISIVVFAMLSALIILAFLQELFINWNQNSELEEEGCFPSREMVMLWICAACACIITPSLAIVIHQLGRLRGK